MKKFLIFCINIVLFASVFYLADIGNSDKSMTEAQNEKFVNIQIIHNKNICNTSIDIIKESLDLFPDNMLDTFSADNWTISVIEEENVQSPFLETISFEEKNVNVYGKEEKLMICTTHQLSHYADKFYGGLSGTSQWDKLMSEYSNEYKDYDTGQKINTYSKEDMFACVNKDFLLHPEYLRDNYPKLYNYFVVIYR